MAVWGNMLSFFPELHRSFEYFSMTPLPKASYTKRKALGKVKGVFQYLKKSELKEQNDSLGLELVPTLWTRQKLQCGNYFIQNEDVVYRIRKPSDWTFEGGFNVYILESVVGNTDSQVPFEDVNLGQNSYD